MPFAKEGRNICLYEFNFRSCGMCNLYILNWSIMKLLIHLSFACLLLSSCSSTPTTPTACVTADIRGEMNNLTTLHLNEEIESVQYVPLEVTADDASLIDGVADYVVTNKYIYVFPVKEQRIALFDRQGHFIKTLISYGQGPGEFSGTLACMQADEENNRLYLYCTDRVWVYSLDGEFIQHISQKYQNVYKRQVGKDRFAAVALPYMPFQAGSFGIGVFTEAGDTIAMKNDFYSPLVPHEKSGFTVSVAATCSDQPVESILFKTGSNDTIFRVSSNDIEGVCVLQLRNSDNEVVRALDITDFSALTGKQSEDGDIFISDLFETSRRYYFRFRHNTNYYVASVDKNTGKTYVEKCAQPGDIKKMAGANLQLGMLGTQSYNHFPIWGRMAGTDLVQVVTPYELDLYRSNSSVSNPKELITKEEEGNPVFVFYKLKTL